MAKEKSKHEVAKQEKNLPAVINYAEDAGKGMEGADRDSFAIPFLLVLQPMSPQVVDGNVPNAKPGLLLNSVTNELYDAPLLVPCAFQRRWVRWAPRDTGGGFKGEFTTAQVNDMRTKGEVKELDGRLYFPLSDGSVNDKKSDRLADTRNHFVLILRSKEEEMPVAAVFALTSTGIKVSKNFLSRIESIKLRGPDQKLFTPPSFSHMYSVKTSLKSNDKGKWYQPEIEMVGIIENPNIYAAAKAFNKQVTEGRVDLAHDSVRDPAAGAGGPDDDRM